MKRITFASEDAQGLEGLMSGHLEIWSRRKKGKNNEALYKLKKK